MMISYQELVRTFLSDFVKIGVPFTILVMVVCVLLIPVLFPF
ncbi:hypothetical protein WID57_07540 [Klebsiella pneumoniae]